MSGRLKVVGRTARDIWRLRRRIERRMRCRNVEVDLQTDSQLRETCEALCRD